MSHASNKIFVNDLKYPSKKLNFFNILRNEKIFHSLNMNYQLCIDTVRVLQYISRHSK